MPAWASRLSLLQQAQVIQSLAASLSLLTLPQVQALLPKPVPIGCAAAQLPESVAGVASATGAEEEAPGEAELEAYGVTLDFRDFIRSLTYSTFRCWLSPLAFN